MEHIYLDHNASTPVAEEALTAMLPFFRELYGNPSSVHSQGRAVRVQLDQAREKVAGLINARPEEIVFTGGGTESINFAIHGAAQALKEAGRHIITSVVEHPAVTNSCRQLSSQGFKVDFLPVDSHGRVDPGILKQRITDETILISIQHANSEVGVLQPVDVIGSMARERGILFHSDMVQSVGKVPIDVQKNPVDLISFSAHKMYGPKGVGALYIRRGSPRLSPLISGGGQERNRRGGTENIPGIVGFGAAAELSQHRLKSDIVHLETLCTRLESLLSTKLTGVDFFTDCDGPRIPNTLCIGFNGVEGQTLMIRLDIEGISVSTGTACGSGSLSPSQVLSAMGVPLERTGGMIRVSFGRNNTVEDVDRFFAALQRIVGDCRRN